MQYSELVTQLDIRHTSMGMETDFFAWMVKIRVSKALNKKRVIVGERALCNTVGQSLKLGSNSADKRLLRPPLRHPLSLA